MSFLLFPWCITTWWSFHFLIEKTQPKTSLPLPPVAAFFASVPKSPHRLRCAVVLHLRPNGASCLRKGYWDAHDAHYGSMGLVYLPTPIGSIPYMDGMGHEWLIFTITCYGKYTSPIHGSCGMVLTVDGSEIPNNHLGCREPCNSWYKLPYQLVQDFFHYFTRYKYRCKV